MNETCEKQLCRLCYGLSNDLRDIFSEEHGYDKKISLYLYLRIDPRDEGLSTKICWSCANYLDNFHHFSEKVDTFIFQLKVAKLLKLSI